VDAEGNGVIAKYKMDGTEAYHTLTDMDQDCRQPNWSPASDLILYQELADGRWDIWLMDADGTNNRKVTSGAGDKTDASFSPDGQWIVYSSDQGGIESADLFVMPVSGGHPIRVTDYEGYDGAPSWSPGGDKIAFERCLGYLDRSDGTTIWTIDARESLLSSRARA